MLLSVIRHGAQKSPLAFLHPLLSRVRYRQITTLDRRQPLTQFHPIQQYAQAASIACSSKLSVPPPVGNSFDLSEPSQYEADLAELAAFEEAEEDLLTPLTHADSVAIRKTWSSTEEAQSAVIDALHDGDVYKLLTAFLDACNDIKYLDSLPTTTITEILRAIRPGPFLNPYKEVHEGIHAFEISRARDRPKQLSEIFATYSRSLRILLNQLRKTQGSLRFTEWKFLLDTARTTGDDQSARMVFGRMVQDGHEPDIECYNFLLEALCWSQAYDPLARFKLRVTPRATEARASDAIDSKPKHKGYRTGVKGVQQEVVAYFDELVRKRLSANTTTYCYLMQAMGREGQIEGVKSVLNKVWSIDVDAIMQDDNDVILFENDLPPESAAYPNQDLLFTIAHIFGSNNDIPAALRVIDILSRKYGLEIGQRTWTELLDWTFVLASPRSGKDKNDQRIGQLPGQSVLNLWQTMTSPPYNFVPTMPVYSYLARASWNTGRIEPMLKVMRKGRREHEQATLATRKSGILTDDHSRFGMSEKAELAYLRAHRDYLYMSRWFRLLLSNNRWTRSLEERLQWQRRTLPLLIEEFSFYRPRSGVSYEIETGRIHFHPDRLLDDNARVISLQKARSPLTGIEKRYRSKPHSGQVYLGPTRQLKTAIRYEARASTGISGHKEPKYQPQWHESVDVKNFGDIYMPYAKTRQKLFRKERAALLESQLAAEAAEKEAVS